MELMMPDSQIIEMQALEIAKLRTLLERQERALKSLRELINGREFLGDWSRAQAAIRKIDEALHPGVGRIRA